jgi:hypothetical protein
VVGRESKLRMGVLEALAAITPFLSRETVLDKAGRDTHLQCSKSTVFCSPALASRCDVDEIWPSQCRSRNCPELNIVNKKNKIKKSLLKKVLPMTIKLKGFFQYKRQI